MISFLTVTTMIATTQEIELFVSGVSAAISLFCGTKIPKNKRR